MFPILNPVLYRDSTRYFQRKYRHAERAAALEIIPSACEQ